MSLRGAVEAWLERRWYRAPGAAEPWWELLAFVPLLIVERSFALAVWLRNALYDRGWLRTDRLEGVHVISVGNLAVGGAGKTPAVILLARLLTGAGRRVAVLSRGYGRDLKEPVILVPGEGTPSAQEAGDEPLLIARGCRGVPVLVGADRVALARLARDSLGVDTLLLDDGFQHRRLARDVDVVVLGESELSGRTRLLPLGPLREPLDALRRAHVLWTGERVDPGALGFRGSCIRVQQVVQAVVSPRGERLGPEALRGRVVLAMSGIARPARFVSTLEGLGARVAHLDRFPDHHRYSAAELEAVANRAAALGAEVVTTEKDRVRLPDSFSTWVVGLEVCPESPVLDILHALGVAPRAA